MPLYKKLITALIVLLAALSVFLYGPLTLLLVMAGAYLRDEGLYRNGPPVQNVLARCHKTGVCCLTLEPHKHATN